MAIKIRNYEQSRDNQSISDFLVANYLPDNRDGNWLQPRWEYMNFRSDIIAKIDTSRIGIWEDDRNIVGIAHPEEYMGELYLQVHRDYTFLKNEMLDYAENNLFGVDEKGRKFINLFVYDFDDKLVQIVKERGYKQRQETVGDYLSQFIIPHEFPKISIPSGFALKSLEEENDLQKVERLWWRGFNHPGEPPEYQHSVMLTLQTAPNYRKDLNIIIEAPNGDFASYCGMWNVASKGFCYVEPVATDPNYRLKGLMRTVVLEGIRRCGLLGAEVAYVTTGREVYERIGFKRLHANHWWIKSF